MGLNTTHGCWDGPYSSFMRWREVICQVSGYGDLRKREFFTEDSKGVLWPETNDTIFILLQHSDYEGEIEVKNLIPLADRLEGLLPNVHDVWMKEKTEKFIAGLRLAASKGEVVEFL